PQVGKLESVAAGSSASATPAAPAGKWTRKPEPGAAKVSLNGSMPSLVGGGRLWEWPYFVTARIVTFNLQVFRRRVIDEADLDHHVAIGFKLGDLLPFAIAQVSRHVGMHRDHHPADLVAMRGQRQKSHHIDGHALRGLGNARAAAVPAVLVDRTFKAGANP